MIVLARIDDRLIHGQVVVGWAHAVKATHLVVVHDVLAKDENQQGLMRLAVAPPLKALFLSVDQAAGALKEGKAGGRGEAFAAKDRVLIIFPSPAEVVELVHRGVVLKEVNVGGMRFGRGKREILKSVFVSEEEAVLLRRLGALGVRLVGMMVPTDHPVDVAKLL